MRYFPTIDPSLPKPWERVWRAGRDVTTEPVASWPTYPQRYFREGWRPKLYPGELVEWPDPETMTPVAIRGARDGRRGRGRA